jgi:hypothetical protein
MGRPLPVAPLKRDQSYHHPSEYVAHPGGAISSQFNRSFRMRRNAISSLHKKLSIFFEKSVIIHVKIYTYYLTAEKCGSINGDAKPLSSLIACRLKMVEYQRSIEGFRT